MAEAQAKAASGVAEGFLQQDVDNLKLALDADVSLYEIKLQAEQLDRSLKDFEYHWKQYMFCNETNLQDPAIGKDFYKGKYTAAQDVRIRAQTYIDKKAAEVAIREKFPNAQLPRRSVPKFDGEQRNWDRFWLSFKSIHQANAPREVKYAYLLESLTDSAKDIADSYGADESSYESIIDQLKERYEKPELVIFNLRRDIFMLEPPEIDDVASLESFVIKTESICKQLTDKKQSNDQVESLIAVGTISKLSPEILRDLTFIDIDIYKVKLTELLEALKRLTNLKKMHAKSLVSDFHQVYNVKPSKKMSVWEKPKTSVQTISAGQNFKGKQQGASGKKCIFCLNDHRSALCATFATGEDRKKQAKKNGLCTRCLGTSHGNCSRKIYCHSCKKDNHHSFLCRGKEQKRQKALPLQSEIRENAPTLLVNNANQKPNEIKNGLLHIKSDRNTQKTQFRLQSGVFPTAKIEVGKSKNGRHTSVRSLWDSCSSSSYMTKELAEKLKLKPTNKNVEIEVSMGLNEMAQTCHFDVVYANIKIAGENRRLQFLVVDKLPYNLYNPGMKEACDNLKKAGVQLADDIESDVTSQIQVLLGGFHMSMFVNGVQRKLGINLLRIPSGYMPFGGLGKFRTKTLHKVSQSVITSKEIENVKTKQIVKNKRKKETKRKNVQTSNNVMQVKKVKPSVAFIQNKDAVAMEYQDFSQDF